MVLASSTVWAVGKDESLPQSRTEQRQSDRDSKRVSSLGRLFVLTKLFRLQWDKQVGQATRLTIWVPELNAAAHLTLCSLEACSLEAEIFDRLNGYGSTSRRCIRYFF